MTPLEGHGRHHQTEEIEEESYFVSMTDLMTSMLFIFIIMLAYFAIQLREQINEPSVPLSVHSKLQADYRALEEDFHNLEIRIDALLARHALDRLSIANLQRRISLLEVDYTALKQNLLVLQDAKKADEATIARLRQELDRLALDNAELRARIEDLEQQNIDLRQEVERLQDSQTSRIDRYLSGATQRRTELLRQIADAVRAQAGIEVAVIEEQGLLRFQNDILFQTGSAKIPPGSPAEKALKALSAALSAALPCVTLGPDSAFSLSCNPSFAVIDAIQIEGHTDDVPVSAGRRDGIIDNIELSARRATETFRLLRAAAPALTRFRNPRDEPIMSFSGYGALRPLAREADESPDAWRDRNRRIDMRILMFTPRADEIARLQKRLLGKESQ